MPQSLLSRKGSTEVLRAAITDVVTAALAGPDEWGQRPETVDVDFVNNGPSPVLVGLSVRAELWTGWCRAWRSSKITSWPGRRRYRIGRQGTIGVIPANGTARLPVQVPAGPGWCRVVAVAGEAGGHLRVISLRIPVVPAAVATDVSEDVALSGLFMWYF